MTATHEIGKSITILLAGNDVLLLATVYVVHVDRVSNFETRMS